MRGKPDESKPAMLGFIKYGGREPDAREEEVAAEGVDDMGIVVEAEE